MKDKLYWTKLGQKIFHGRSHLQPECKLPLNPTKAIIRISNLSQHMDPSYNSLHMLAYKLFG